MPPRIMRTKTGEVVTADLADALADEAEQGYDLTEAKRHRIKEPAANPQGSTTVAEPDAAPYDDEELTDEARRAVKAARSASRFLVRSRGGAEFGLNRGPGLYWRRLLYG